MVYPLTLPLDNRVRVVLVGFRGFAADGEEAITPAAEGTGSDLAELAAAADVVAASVGSACHSERDAVSGGLAALGAAAARAAGAVRLSVARPTTRSHRPPQPTPRRNLRPLAGLSDGARPLCDGVTAQPAGWPGQVVQGRSLQSRVAH